MAQESKDDEDAPKIVEVITCSSVVGTAFSVIKGGDCLNHSVMARPRTVLWWREHQEPDTAPPAEPTNVNATIC
jgi:hypothetical protein